METILRSIRQEHKRRPQPVTFKTTVVSFHYMKLNRRIPVASVAGKTLELEVGVVVIRIWSECRVGFLVAKIGTVNPKR